MQNAKQRKHHTLGFSTALMQELINNIDNFYGIDNWDYERFDRYKNRFATSMFVGMNTLLKNLEFISHIGKKSALKLEC